MLSCIYWNLFGAISSVTNLPANVIEVSAAILNLDNFSPIDATAINQRRQTSRAWAMNIA